LEASEKEWWAGTELGLLRDELGKSGAGRILRDPVSHSRHTRLGNNDRQ
jgi:hypothetical protein